MNEHPIRLLITDDLERSRITVGLRLLLAIPHYIWVALWTVVAVLAAFANWVGTLLLGRPPVLLHRFLAAYVKYVTQLYAYLRLAANPYPSFDGPDGYPIDLRLPPPAPQSRVTVLFRVVLAIPAWVLAEVLGGGTSSAFRRRSNSSLPTNGLGGTLAVAGWFVSVATARMPRGLRDTTAWSLGYGAQFWSYLLLLTDRYPDSDPLAMLGDVPVREDPVRLRSEDDLHRSRLTVGFRLPLSVPHLVWLLLWSLLAWLVAIANWVVTLIRGTPPAGIHRFLSRFLRYEVSVYAFLFIVANPFPGFAGAPGSYPPLEAGVAPPARQNRWKVGFRLVLAIPAAIIAGAFSSLLFAVGVLSWFSALVRGRVPTGLRTAGAVALRYHAATLGYVLVLTDAYPYTGPLLGDAPQPREHPSAPEAAGPLSPSGDAPPTWEEPAEEPPWPAGGAPPAPAGD